MPLPLTTVFFSCLGIFTAVTALSVLFVYFLVPETSGKSLEEIQVFFRQLAGEEEEEEKEPLVVNAIIQECE